MKIKLSRLLLAYSAVVMTAAAGFSLSHAVGQQKVTAFDTIDVQRLNVREADGTLRMAIANKALFPGAIFKGKEYPHASRADTAGMIMFDDEGTEDGGLIFGGKTGPDGKVQSFGHLSFDQYMQDQVVNLEQSEYDGRRAAGLTINDMPDAPMDIETLSRIESMKDGPEKQAIIKKLIAEGAGGRHRLFVGKQDKTAMLALDDAAGKPRVVMKVTPEGAASIEFLDEAGKTVRTVTPTAG
jgi:hypothetical protein